jgi:hypothetical protein
MRRAYSVLILRQHLLGSGAVCYHCYTCLRGSFNATRTSKLAEKEAQPC